MRAGKDKFFQTDVIMRATAVTERGKVISSSSVMTFVLTEIELANGELKVACGFRRPDGSYIDMSSEQSKDAADHIHALASLVQTLAIQHTPAEGTA